jgi:phage tail sheath protein FI
VSDPEVVESNLMVIPGITNTTLTDHLLSVCADRADSLAIIDLEGGFIPSTENTYGDSSATNRGDVDSTISNLKARGLNSSYGCAYYPWVQTVDTVGVGSTFWCPPSIVALGTMGSSEQKSELWFAPAGFTRGGLTEGSAGIPVIGVRQKLTSKERDKLYEANINAIASFPSEGIVIFGQKTLQVTPSALDRINVRRLLIYIKKEVSGMCKTVLFDQNVRATWNRLSGKVEPFLLSLQTRLGLTDWKWVLDETTTTADLVDRNTLYAKLFLKPAKSLEFIAVDMVVSNEGASFA